MESNVILNSTLPLASQLTVRRAIALIENHLREPGVAFTSATAAREWLRLNLTGLEREVFMVLLLDNQNRLLAHETLFSGSISSTEVHPREVVKAAHNHPSGHPEPSDADRRITERLKKALALVDVRLPDHFVIGSKEIVSFAERGWL